MTRRLLLLTAAAELDGQTPPNGDRGPVYFCPACGAEDETRGGMREHLARCEAYRSFIDASVRRADLIAG